MSISFVIPAHNAGNVIESCLKSIFRAAQNITGSEIIVVENASHDATADIARSLGVTVIQINTASRSIARNIGWKKAKNEWIAFVDADTELSEEWAQKILERCNVEGCGGGQGPIIPLPCKPLSLSDFRETSSKQRTRGSYNSLNIVAFETPMINTAACLYRKEALESVGGLDEALSRHEDIDLSKRVSLAGWGFRAVPEATAYVNWHGSGWSGYLKRAFEIGKTKNEYNAKWFPYQSMKLESRILINDFKRIFSNLSRYRQNNDYYFAQKFIIDLLQEFGKISFFLSYWNMERNFKKDSSLSHKCPGTNNLFLKKSFRVIDLGKSVNILNLRTNQVLILDNVESDILLRFISWEKNSVSSEEIDHLVVLDLIETQT